MGLDVDSFEGQVDEDLICSICKKVLETPSSSTCGHIFCAKCLQKATEKRTDCPKCGEPLAPIAKDADREAEELLVDRLGKLSIRCTHQSFGCPTVLPWLDLGKHAEKECEYRLVPCENRGCADKHPLNRLEQHMESCDHRIVECKVCKTRLPRKDMPAHQAVKRCFEELNKRKRVSSARRLSSELKEHRLEMLHRRHQTEQAARRIEKEHYFPPPPRRRAMSAGPVLLHTQSVESRVGSAIVVPHYTRNLKSAAVLDSCRGCSNRFLSGRRPSARRHSHSKVRLLLPYHCTQNNFNRLSRFSIIPAGMLNSLFSIYIPSTNTASKFITTCIRSHCHIIMMIKCQILHNII